MSKTSTKSPDFTLKMIWSFKKLFVVCSMLTFIILMLPNLYFISEQSVSYRHLVLNEINKFSNVFDTSANQSESLNTAINPVESQIEPPKPLSKPTIQEVINAKSVEEKSKINEIEEKSPNSTTNSTSKINVILLAYHRTGSSVTGEILSLIPNSAYFFEPLYYVNIVQRTPSPDKHVNFLNELFACDEATLNEVYTKSSVHVIRKLRGNLVKKNDVKIRKGLTDYCLKSDVKIAKTIRLRIDDYVAAVFFQNIKIIHLVRDPRAMLSSVNQATIWREEDRTPERACEALSKEVLAGDAMPHNIYLRIKYEDLVLNPTKTSQRMFNFLGVNVDDKVLNDYVTTHMKAETNPGMTKYSGSYFSTIRNSSFNFNHWKDEVSQEFIYTVETYCEWVMERLGYETMSDKV